MISGSATRVTAPFACAASLAILAALAWPAPARAAGESTIDITYPRTAMMGNRAPDFPPGAFTDGGQYHVNDYRGKVLILFFVDPEYISQPADLKPHVVFLDLYKNKPIKYLGVVTGTSRDVNSSQRLYAQLHLNIPAYIDNLGMMGARYNERYASWGTSVIGPDGKVAAYEATPTTIDDALKQTHWKYKDGGYDPALARAVDLLEWNQTLDGMRILRPLRKAGTKTVAESAEKLYQAVHAEGEQWKEEAERIEGQHPAEAYDLYQRIATVFAGDDLAKAADEPLKRLKADKVVQSEAAARRVYQQLYTAVPRARFEQKLDVSEFCDKIAADFKGTPTAARAQALSDNLLGTRR